MTHILPALAIQLLLSPFSWWAGALLAAGFYLGREHAQAEYRVIQTYYGGKRANMPWYGGFERRGWDRKSILDFVLPIVATMVAVVIISATVSVQ
jgi:hypothetical protein